MGKTKTFDLSGYQRLSVKSIVIRETDGNDEDKAADMAKSKGLTGSLTEELVRLSIVSFDGTPAVFPFATFDGWPKRTRDMVVRCFNKVNGTRDIAGIDEALEGAPIGDAYRFDFSKVPGCSIQTLDLREVTGRDEDEAVRKSVASKTPFMEELFKLALMSVDGGPATGIDPKTWNSRTRTLAFSAYQKLNSVLGDDEPTADEE